MTPTESIAVLEQIYVVTEVVVRRADTELAPNEVFDGDRDLLLRHDDATSDTAGIPERYVPPRMKESSSSASIPSTGRIDSADAEVDPVIDAQAEHAAVSL